MIIVRNTAALVAATILLTVTFLAVTTSVQAKVRISERTTFYNVSGKTGVELFRSIQRRAPRRSRTTHAIATTTYSVKIGKVKSTIRGRRCVVTHADVRVKIVYKYPRWRNQRRASPKVKKAWKAFYKGLQVHERTHGRITKEYARKLHRELLKAKGRVSRKCKDFGKSTFRRISRLGKNLDRRHNRFDRREGRRTARIRRLQRALARTR